MKLRINESNIPESDADELYRIAEYELLPKTQLYKISEHCTIDEDTFEYTHTGTAWGGYICYDIYMEWTAEYLPRISDFYRDNIDDVWHRDWKLNEIKIDFTIHVDGDRVTVDISDMDIVEPRNFERIFDLDALCDAIREIAENSANYIHSKIGAYEPYDDIDESVGMRESKEGIMLKSVTSSGTWYLIKSATRNKSFWNKELSYVNEFAKKESAIKKLYTVLHKLPDNAFYDEDDDLIYDAESADDLKKAKFAKFYITDMRGKEIEDISDDVKKYLLSDDEFISALLDDIDDD